MGYGYVNEATVELGMAVRSHITMIVNLLKENSEEEVIP